VRPFRRTLAQKQERHDDTDHTHWHVDRENQAPVGIGHEVAAKGRANGRGQQRGDTQDAGRQASLVGREFVEEQGDRQREECCAADGLGDPKDNQRGLVPGEATERGTQGEQNQRDDVEALRTQAVREESRGRRDHALGEGISRDDPGDSKYWAA